MIRFAIGKPIATAMAYLAAALLGIAAWRNIPVELLPESDLPRLYVRAWWGGASPQTVEAFVTSPLEAAIQQVRGVEKVSSVSEEQYGRSAAEIAVEFARGTDMDFARLDLSERLGMLKDELPPEVTGPVVEQYVPDALRAQQRSFLQYTLAGPHTTEALRAHIDDVIAPEIRRVDGVADVVAFGGRNRMLEIELDPLKASALGLDADVVRKRVEELEYVKEAGAVRDRQIVRVLAMRERAESAAEVLDAVLLTDRGRVVRLRDVATIHDTFEPPRSHYRIDGLSAVSFSVYREQGTNAVAVGDRVKARLVELERIRPRELRLILNDDESAAIRAQFADLRTRSLLSAAIIFAVLLAFLRSFRSAAIVFATIAFSVMITLNFMYFAGYTLNVLTLMGLAMGFGIIVDTSIVVLENIYRRRRSGEAPAEAAQRGTSEVVLALLVSTLATVVVFIPFVYLQGELRVYYIPLAIVTVLSQIAGLLVSFTFVPALAARLLRFRERPVSEQPAANGPAWYVSIYSRLLGSTLRFPWLTVAATLALLGGSYFVFDKYVPRGLVWRSWWEDQSYLAVRISLPRGEELERTDEIVRYFEAKIRKLPEVERFVTHVRAQSADITVTFSDSIEKTAAPLVIKERLTSDALQFGGAEVQVIGFGPSFFGGGISPPTYSIAISGYNYQTVQRIAEDVGVRLKRLTARVRDVDVNATGRWYERDKASEVILRIDRARLSMFSLTAKDVVRQVAAAVGAASSVSQIRVGEEELRLAVALSGSSDMEVSALRELLLPIAGGAGVRLGDVATIEERDVLGRIVREDQQYQRNVSYEFRGPPKLGDRYQKSIIATTALPDGYRMDAKADWGWNVEEKEQVYGVLALSLLLIFMVTASLFESLRQPLCVVLTVPMALVGVFLTFWLSGASFTREAYIGVIMMGGIVVNNAILLVDRVNQLRREEKRPLREALVAGTLQRVRPILMTSVATVLGLLPLVLFSEHADATIWNALGFALIGGLTSSTILVLTVTPALYLLLERGPEARSRPVAA